MGLRVVAVSDPAHPVEKAVLPVSGGHSNRVAVIGQRAYVADGWAGVQALDLTNPLAPVVIGRYQSPAVEAHEAKPFGHYAVAANRGELKNQPGTYQGGVRVLDLSALPAEPSDPPDPPDPPVKNDLPLLTVGAAAASRPAAGQAKER